MKNKIYALLIHLINVIFTSVIMIFSDILFKTRPNKIIAVVVTLIPIFIYFKLARMLPLCKNKNRDITTGVFITLISLCILFFVTQKNGLTLSSQTLGSYSGRLVIDIFLSPVLFPLVLLGYRYNFGMMIAAAFIPQLMIYVAILLKRRKRRKLHDIF